MQTLTEKRLIKLWTATDYGGDWYELNKILWEIALVLEAEGHDADADADLFTFLAGIALQRAVDDTQARKIKEFGMATKLPDSYRAARLRCVLPYHADIDRMGLGFDLADGTVLRLALDGESARALISCLEDHLAIGCQSPRSSEMPRVEGKVAA